MKKILPWLAIVIAFFSLTLIPPLPAAAPYSLPAEQAKQSRAIGDEEPQVDLLAIPSHGRPANTGGLPEPGYPQGTGLCVFTSIQYASWWQNEPKLKDFQAKMKANEKGGGWPQKVDEMIGKYGPGTRYIQYEGKNPAVIELALKTGRVPCVTWQGNHMLCCVHLDASRAAILDNNSPNKLSWMSREVFLSRWTQGPGSGWVVVLLNPPPPPAPRNINPRPSPTEPNRIGKPCLCKASNPCQCGRNCPSKGENCKDGCTCAVARETRTGTTYERGVRRIATEDWWSWNLCGKEVTWGEAIGALVDDSTKPHLTLIGDKASREQATGLLSSMLTNYCVQEYTPDAWELTVGFATAGKPSVYLQTRQGGVILRREQANEELKQALRKADPNYDPRLDPVAPAPKPTPAPPSPGPNPNPIQPPNSGPFLTPEQALAWAKNNPGTVLIAIGGAFAGYWFLIRKPVQPAPLPTPTPTPKDPLEDLIRTLGQRELARLASQGQAPKGTP